MRPPPPSGPPRPGSLATPLTLRHYFAPPTHGLPTSGSAPGSAHVSVLRPPTAARVSAPRRTAPGSYSGALPPHLTVYSKPSRPPSPGPVVTLGHPGLVQPGDLGTHKTLAVGLLLSAVFGPFALVAVFNASALKAYSKAHRITLLHAVSLGLALFAWIFLLSRFSLPSADGIWIVLLVFVGIVYMLTAFVALVAGTSLRFGVWDPSEVLMGRSGRPPPTSLDRPKAADPSRPARSTLRATPKSGGFRKSIFLGSLKVLDKLNGPQEEPEDVSPLLPSYYGVSPSRDKRESRPESIVYTFV